jgi:hypothetical protein
VGSASAGALLPPEGGAMPAAPRSVELPQQGLSGPVGAAPAEPGEGRSSAVSSRGAIGSAPAARAAPGSGCDAGRPRLGGTSGDALEPLPGECSRRGVPTAVALRGPAGPRSIVVLPCAWTRDPACSRKVVEWNARIVGGRGADAPVVWLVASGSWLRLGLRRRVCGRLDAEPAGLVQKIALLRGE